MLLQELWCVQAKFVYDRGMAIIINVWIIMLKGNVIPFIIFVLGESWNSNIKRSSSKPTFSRCSVIPEYVSSTISSTGKQYVPYPLLCPLYSSSGSFEVHCICGGGGTQQQPSHFTHTHVVPSALLRRLYLRFAITLHDHSFTSSQSLKHFEQYKYVDLPVANGVWPLNCLCPSFLNLVMYLWDVILRASYQ